MGIIISITVRRMSYGGWQLRLTPAKSSAFASLEWISWILWQRQKNSSPVNPLKVTFMGEAGVDTGALRKEFLTGQEHYLFHNSQINIKVQK